MPARAASTTVTSSPRSRKNHAVDSPTMPPPTTRTCPIALLRPSATNRAARAARGLLLRRPRHAQHVESLVELCLGDLAPLDVAELDHGLADRDALLDRVLGDLGRGLVADHAVERRDDRGGGLRVGAGLLDVRLDARDRAVREHARGVREQTDR